MTKFTPALVLVSTLIAGGLMAGASHAASAIIVPNDTAIHCGSGNASSAHCADAKGQDSSYTVKSLAGTGDHDDDSHESENDGDDD